MIPKIFLLPIYPNPGNSFLVIKVLVPLGQKFDLSLYDMQGRIIYKHKESEDLTKGIKIITVPTEELSAGSYLLRLNDKNGIQVRKWVKE